MDLQAILKDASKDEGAGPFVLFDDDRLFLGQFATVDDVLECIAENHLKCPALYNLAVLDEKSYVFVGDKLHVF